MKAKLFSQILFYVIFFNIMLSACASVEPSLNEGASPAATETVERFPTATEQPSHTPEPPPSASATEQPSHTPQPPIASATEQPSHTPQPLPTASVTEQPSHTPEPPTASATEQPSHTPQPPTASATEQPSHTPQPPTASATEPPSHTPQPPTASATEPPSHAPEPPPTASEVPTVTLAPSNTPEAPLPPTLIPTMASTETSEVQIMSEESGVEGRVELGSTCGNMPTEGDANCENQPYQAYLTITDLNGLVVTEGPSNADGFYRFALPPGDYMLVPEKSNGPISADPMPFTVTEGNFTYVPILYHTLIP